MTPRQPGWDIDFVKSPAPRLLYCSGYFAESEWKILYSMKTEPPLILVTRWSGWLIDWIWDEMWAELSELGCCDATLHHNLMFPPSLSLFSPGLELGRQRRVFISNKIIRRVGFIKTRGLARSWACYKVKHPIAVHIKDTMAKILLVGTSTFWTCIKSTKKIKRTFSIFYSKCWLFVPGKA